MKDLLIKAQGLVDALNTELAEAKQKTAEANQLSASARILKNSLDAQAAELADRERSLDNLEKPIKEANEARRIKTENAALATKVEEGKYDLDRNRKAFATYKADQEQLIAQAKMEAASAKENFKKQEAICKEKEAKLDEIKKQIKGL